MRKIFTINQNRPQDKNTGAWLLQERSGTFPAWQGDNPFFDYTRILENDDVRLTESSDTRIIE